MTLFVEFSHYGYWDLDFCRKSAEILKDRIARYRQIGIKKVGINVMCTIGHLEEGWEVLPRAELQYQVNEFGEESKATLCPSNSDFLEYVKAKYTLFAEAGADFIWYDDDVRPIYHGVAQNGCFCDGCIEKFNNENGFRFSRNELAKGIFEDNLLGEKWRDFQNENIIKVIEVIEKSVHSIDNNVTVGAMTTRMLPEKHFKAYIDKAKTNMCRPGGGFYNDDEPCDVLRKIYGIQKQVSGCPNNVDDIQYEYEAFNYQNLDKSMHLSEIEINMAIFSGCNGILFNNDIFNDREDIIELMRKRSNMWDLLSHQNKSLRPCGVYCKSEHFAKQLNEIGICTTNYPENSVAFFILGGEWNEYSDKEIEKMLNNPIFTDGQGVEILNNRGFGDKCGAKVQNIYSCGIAERFTEHKLNGSYKNYYRDVFINFFNEGTAYEFELSENAEKLAELETITHIKKGCGMYLYGDKFAADGYLMPKSLLSSAKRQQLLNVLDKISQNALPLKINKPLKLVPMVNCDKYGNITIMLTNMSFDDTGYFECEIRNKAKFYRIGKDGSLNELKQEKIGENTVIQIDNIGKFEYLLLTNIKKQ